MDAAKGYSLCRGIFAADLPGVDTFRSALFVLQASDARPGTLKIVAHCDVQRAAAFAGQLHLVAVHKRIKSSMIGAGCENVAGLQRVDRRDPFDTARNLVRHVVSVEILHHSAIVRESNLQLVWVLDLVGGHNVWADRGEGVTRLHLIEDVGRR